jgi:hypothetical protein
MSRSTPVDRESTDRIGAVADRDRSPATASSGFDGSSRSGSDRNDPDGDHWDDD